jgi:hypothetical protein
MIVKIQFLEKERLYFDFGEDCAPLTDRMEDAESDMTGPFKVLPCILLQKVRRVLTYLNVRST